MAAKFIATTTVTDTNRTVTVRGHEFPAAVVTCTCDGCKSRSVLVPAATVDAISGTARKVDLALHNLVAQSKLLGFAVA